MRLTSSRCSRYVCGVIGAKHTKTYTGVSIATSKAGGKTGRQGRSMGERREQQGGTYIQEELIVLGGKAKGEERVVEIHLGDL